MAQNDILRLFQDLDSSQPKSYRIENPLAQCHRKLRFHNSNEFISWKKVDWAQQVDGKYSLYLQDMKMSFRTRSWFYLFQMILKNGSFVISSFAIHAKWSGRSQMWAKIRSKIPLKQLVIWKTFSIIL